MKKKKKSKQKSQHRRPPLSALDKVLYAVGFLLLLVVGYALSFLFEDLRSLIAFRDPAVISCTEHASYLLILPLFIFVLLCMGIPLLSALDKKAAIFGNPKVQYGKDPWDKNYFPLLDRRRHTMPVSKSERKLRRGIFTFCCITLLLSLFLASFSFFGRNCLLEDNSIVSYNAVNRISSTYHEDDFSQLTLQTRYVSGYRTSSYWKYEITIEMHSGRSFSFSNRDFGEKGNAHKELSLHRMLEIKSLFPSDRITIKGTENVDKVANYLGLNESQIQQLYLLFSN